MRRKIGLTLGFVPDRLQVYRIYELPRLAATASSFRIDLLTERVTRGGSIPHPHHAIVATVHRPLREPFGRGLVEQRAVLLPHGVVRGAGEVDQHLLGGAEIGVEVAHARGVDLA